MASNALSQIQRYNILRPHISLLSRSAGHIGITANEMQDKLDICLQAGMNDYLSKRVKLEDLMLMLDKWRAATTV